MLTPISLAYRFKKINEMKKPYIFLFLMCSLLYLMYLVGTYKYQEYKIEQYIEDIKLQNEVLREKI